MNSAVSTLRTTPPPDALEREDAAFLSAIGRRVRERRGVLGITRKRLAALADVSERYLGQLETGEGNISILLLRRIARALAFDMADVLATQAADPVQVRIGTLVARLPAQRRSELLAHLEREPAAEAPDTKRDRIALIGLRGAGKSTLGQALAEALDVPFVELNREIERDTGMPVAEVFDLYGQGGYRRIERRCLERVLEEHERVVLSLAGGVVSDGDTFDLLLRRCRTVWLKATPAEHMARVLAQGDLRPMAGHADAMEDLKRILAAREPLYRKAELAVDTSGQSPAESLAALRHAVGL